VPHAPQSKGSLERSAHRAPHCVSPAAHDDVHRPLEQTCPLAQGTPHPPQLAGSFSVSAHDDPHFCVLPTHLQAPELHTPAVPHDWPQAPQLFGSDSRSAQSALEPLPQSMVAPEHDDAHAPALHTDPAPHASPHDPQLPGSLFRSTQAPEQSVSCGSEGVHAQWAATQISGAAQAVPQEPQLAESQPVSVQRAAEPDPHSVWAAAQLEAHEPLVQTLGAAQGTPHPPQVAGSFCGSTHAGPHAISG
jgi:hypothetical protein